MVEPGVYRIKNVKSHTYLDASLSHEGTVHGWGNRPNNDNQKWEVVPRGQGVLLKNVGTGAYASVDNHNQGTRVEASRRPYEWVIAGHEDGKYAIHPINSSSAVDLDEGNPEDGASIAIWEFRNAGQQLWRFERAGGGGGGYGGQQQGGYGGQQQASYGGQPQQAGYSAPPQNYGGYSGAIPAGRYRIHNVASGTALDLAGGGSDEGAPILGWQRGSGANQTWILEPGSNGYRVKNGASGTYLTFQQGPGEGVALVGGQQPQEFQIVQSNEGYQFVLASSSNFVVDLAGGKSDDGAKVLLWHNGQGRNQQWQFERA